MIPLFPPSVRTKKPITCAPFASRYFAKPVTGDDIVWRYSGVRPLYDDGAKSATAATRDYVLSLDDDGAPVLHVFGGKITTYRKLAEGVLAKLTPFFDRLPGEWTAGVALPGGNFAVEEFDNLVAGLERDFGFLGKSWAKRLARNYGTEARDILGAAKPRGRSGAGFWGDIDRSRSSLVDVARVCAFCGRRGLAPL